MQNNSDPTFPLLIGSMTEWPDIYPEDQAVVLKRLLTNEIPMKGMRKVAFKYAKIKYANLVIHRRVTTDPKYLQLPEELKKRTSTLAGLIVSSVSCTDVLCGSKMFLNDAIYVMMCRTP